VGVPEPLGWPWNEFFRSDDRVWSNLCGHLEALGVQLSDDDPDVWLWSGYRELPETDRPIVAILHEAPGPGQGVPPSLLEFTDRTGRLIAERAARVVTCSAASRESIATRYSVAKDQIVVAPYGVDTSIFRPDGPVASSEIRRHGGDDRPYVLFVGTVLPRKNLPLLREAMTRLSTHQLVLVASPCLDPRSDELLEAAVAPIGSSAVPNLAGIDERRLAAVMRGADVLCLPSLSEGFGLPVLEAMACGTPVVVSDRGSLPEVVAGGGVVVPPTLEDIFHGLRRAISERGALATHALRRAQELSWARTAEIVSRCLRDVAGQCGRRT
jgi:glycosyltransferase involved in cell wall biosynthesis